MRILCGFCARLGEGDHCRTVRGVRKARKRVMDSAGEAVKRASRLAGRSCAGTGGMKRAQADCQSNVKGNRSVHQDRHRCSVRSGTASSPARCVCAEVGAARRSDFSTTSNAKYTRRPRKRTDMAVVRLRH